jgi:tRNA threonylcarbamoyladenosine biosynthesis protein TsaB
MRVLAIDTALAACAAAVLDTDSGAIVASESQPMVRGHAEALIPLVGRVAQQADMTLRGVDRIAVTTGPGSFTGLRVGIAAARGIAIAAGVPAVGISTLSAYAAPYLGADESGSVVAVIDARHDHVYLQVFATGGQTLVTPRLAPLSEAVRAASGRVACIVGSAAQTVAAALAKTGLEPATVDARAAPDIAWVARLGSVASETDSPPKPLYLRAPDAQPQHAAQLPRR